MTKIAIVFLLISYISFVAPNNTHVKPLKTGFYYVVDTPTPYKRQLEKSKEAYFLDPNPIVTVKQFAKLKIENDARHHNEAVIKFNAIGTSAFSLATQKHINKKIALIIDDRLIMAPTVQAQISSGMASINTVGYSNNELDHLVKIISVEMN